LTSLKRYVLRGWSLSSEQYTPNEELDFLPHEQKQNIRQAVLHLLVSPDHIIRDLAASILPKIAQADWPNDWPGFLEDLSNVIGNSTNIVELISTLKVLRGTYLPDFPYPPDKYPFPSSPPLVSFIL
jgi:importin-9